MNSPLVLGLLCGFCLAAFATAAGVPDNVRREIQKLTDHFNVKADKALFGSPIFLKNMNHNFQENEQRLLMHESLHMYDKILSSMLKDAKDQEIRMSILAIRARMGELRKNFSSREQDLTRRLQELWALKTDDVTVQRKAVRELLPVYERTAQLCN